MALPLLLGLAGSGLAGAGMLGGMGALTAGAIGSGLGSYLETGDLGKGVQTGLMSYLGGKALGAVMGGGAGSGGADLMQSPESISSLSQAKDLAALNPNIPVTGPIGTGGAMADSTAGLLSGQGAPALNLPPADKGFMGNLFSDSTAGIGSALPADATIGQRFAGAGSALMTPEAMGAAGAAALPGLLAPPELEMAPKKQYNTAEAEAADRQARTPGANFRPGISPEFDYFGPMQTSFADGGLAALRYQEGGEMPNDKELISGAVEAIQGRDESPERTLAMFVSRYGEDALRDLVDRVQSGEFDMNASASEGTLVGAGDGMDDMIPATLEGEQDVVLSDGEFIVPADVVSGLGNGSSNAGSKALYEMMDRVREMRTGQKEQPEQVPQGMMLPA